MKIKTVISVLLALAIMLFTSCATKPNEVLDESAPEDEIEIFVPAEDSGKTDELGKRYFEYLENMSLAFSSNEPDTAENFEYEVYGDTIKITEYIGQGSIVVVPDKIDGLSVTVIGENSFSNKNVRAVSIPDSVNKIEKSAFADSNGLSTLRIPFIGDGESETNFGYVFGASRYDENAVNVPSTLDMVIVGDRCKEIDDNAFVGCKMISAISLPDTIEKIGKFAFYECFDLVCVKFGGANCEILDYAFGYCTSLYEIHLNGVRSIANGAFWRCSSLNGISLPFVGENEQENQYIGHIFGAQSADYNDEFVPISLREITLTEGCDSIPDRAFASCKYITKINIPNSVKSIGVRSFYACRSLRALVIPDSVISVGDDAFFGCDNMTSIELGEGIEDIGMQAFYFCSALKSVKIPKKVSVIRPSTFYGCSSLENVELVGVERIEKDAFGKCDSLIPPETSRVDYIAEGNDRLFESHSDTTEGD